ncbi:Hypothetical protein GL50581_2737 [Giardia duodenalis ATCC 50581]|nr:Hypothetical protein GL50581_2737 [Giardia intestinalis ATCC 50581]
MELAVLDKEGPDVSILNFSDVLCSPQLTAEIPTWESLALSAYSDHEPDPTLQAAFQVWRAQAKMRRLILKPYRRIIRRWHRLTEESKRGRVAWTFYRQVLMQKAFNSLLHRATTCTHLTMRLGFKTLRDIASIRRCERDVADEYYRVHLCAKSLRGLFQAITKRCQTFLQIQRARELRLLSYAFRHMRVEASLSLLALHIYRHTTLYKMLVTWRYTLRIHIVEQRINRVVMRACFIKWRQRYRRGLVFSRDIYIRQGYDEELALTLAIASEDVRLLLRAFYSWLKRTRYELHQKALRSVIDAFQRQYLLRSALRSMLERYRTILARRKAICFCLQSLDRQILTFALSRWKINAQNARRARISCNMIARDRDFLIREQAFSAWREAWIMQRTARTRYGPLASALNRILIHCVFQELQQTYKENCYRLEQAVRFYEALAKQQLHKMLSIWYARFLERKETMHFFRPIVHTLIDRAYGICHTQLALPGQWFLDTPSYRLLQQAWSAILWKYRKRSAYRKALLQADKKHDNKLLTRIFLIWRSEAKVSILLTIQRPRIITSTFTIWRLATEQSQKIGSMKSQAEMKHEYSLLHRTFCDWRHMRKVIFTEHQLEQALYRKRIDYTLSLVFGLWHTAYLQDVYLRFKEQEVTALWSRKSLIISLRSFCALYLSRLRLRANRRQNVFTETLEEIAAHLSSICIGRLLSDIRTEHMKSLVHVPQSGAAQGPDRPAIGDGRGQAHPLRLAGRSCWETLRGHREKYRSAYDDSADRTPRGPQSRGSDSGTRQLICVLDDRIAALGHRLVGRSP